MGGNHKVIGAAGCIALAVALPVRAADERASPGEQRPGEAAALEEILEEGSSLDVGSQDPSASIWNRLVRVVVFELSNTGLPQQHVALLSASLLAEIRKLKGVSAMGMDELRAMLTVEETDAMRGCEDDQSCLSSIAGALGADFLIIGDVGRVGASSVLNLKRLDMSTAQSVGGVNRRMLGGTGEEFLEAIGPAVEELFPEFPLRQGVSRGVSSQVVARWNPPPIQPWMTWTAIGVAAVTGVAGAAFFVVQKLTESEYQKMMRESQETGVSGKRVVAIEGEFKSANRLATGLGSVALAAGVAGAVMFLFTDWQGEVEVKTGVGPVPGGLGVTMSGRF